MANTTKRKAGKTQTVKKNTAKGKGVTKEKSAETKDKTTRIEGKDFSAAERPVRYKRITTGEARGQFSEIISQASYGKKRVILTRHGKDLVAVVPVEDLELIEELQDRLDVQEAERRLKDPRESSIPYEQVRKNLGLE